MLSKSQITELRLWSELVELSQELGLGTEHIGGIEHALEDGFVSLRLCRVWSEHNHKEVGCGVILYGIFPRELRVFSCREWYPYPIDIVSLVRPFRLTRLDLLEGIEWLKNYKEENSS